MAGLLAALRRPSLTNEPPTAAERWRNDTMVIAVVVVAILLGLLLRNLTTRATSSFSLGENLPTVRYPAGWLADQSAEGLLLRAVDLKSPSSFNTRLEILARDLRASETLGSVSTSWPLSRGRQYDRYRILNSQTVAGPDGQQALLLTYAYVADPTRESGMTGLPVVVQAQDLLAVVEDGGNGRLIALTVAADATRWEADAPGFQRIFESLLDGLPAGGGSADNADEGGE
jgi:hypothetical protein